VSGFGPSPGRWESLPFGAVSLTERFLRESPPSEQEVGALEEQVAGEVRERCSEMPEATPLFAGSAAP